MWWSSCQLNWPMEIVFFLTQSIWFQSLPFINETIHSNRFHFFFFFFHFHLKINSSQSKTFNCLGQSMMTVKCFEAAFCASKTIACRRCVTIRLSMRIVNAIFISEKSLALHQRLTVVALFCSRFDWQRKLYGLVRSFVRLFKFIFRKCYYRRRRSDRRTATSANDLLRRQLRRVSFTFPSIRASTFKDWT